MSFLWSLPRRYEDLLDQFCSCYKDLESASIDSIVADIRFHDEFKVVELDKKPPAGKLPCAATASTNTDRQGKAWNNPFEWLAQLHINSMKKRWKRVLVGSGICLICNREGDEHKHVPAICPLLKELNLKLIQGPPTTPTSPANAPAPGPAVANPGGRSAMTDDTSAMGSSGSGNVLSGLMATLAEEDFPLDDEWRWDGDESGLDFQGASAGKSNDNAALYPSCLHVSLERSPNTTTSICLTTKLPAAAPSQLPLGLSPHCIVLSSNIQAIIARMLKASILPGSSRHFTVANSGATDYMTPNKSAFILYKTVHNLQVRMGNNSFLLVLGRGSAIVSL